jgi:hypothetical protein
MAQKGVVSLHQPVPLHGVDLGNPVVYSDLQTGTRNTLKFLL